LGGFAKHIGKSWAIIDDYKRQQKKNDDKIITLLQ
jgi:hypothetical protein